MMALRLEPFCNSVTPSTLGRKGDGGLEMNMKRESRQGQQICAPSHEIRLWAHRTLLAKSACVTRT